MSIPIYSFYSIKKENYQWWMPENDFTRLWWWTIKNWKIPYIQSEKMIEKRLKIMWNIKDFKKKINIINNILVIK